MEEAEVVDGSPIEPCRSAPEMLELAEAALDGVADLVGGDVVGDRTSPRWVAGDDRLGPHAANQLAQGVAVVGFVGEHAAGREAVEESWRQQGIPALAGSEGQIERSPGRISGHMDLGHQSSAGAP